MAAPIPAVDFAFRNMNAFLDLLYGNQANQQVAYPGVGGVATPTNKQLCLHLTSYALDYYYNQIPNIGGNVAPIQNILIQQVPGVNPNPQAFDPLIIQAYLFGAAAPAMPLVPPQFIPDFYPNDFVAGAQVPNTNNIYFQQAQTEANRMVYAGTRMSTTITNLYAYHPSLAVAFLVVYRDLLSLLDSIHDFAKGRETHLIDDHLTNDNNTLKKTSFNSCRTAYETLKDKHYISSFYGNLNKDRKLKNIESFHLANTIQLYRRRGVLQPTRLIKSTSYDQLANIFGVRPPPQGAPGPNPHILFSADASKNLGSLLANAKSPNLIKCATAESIYDSAMHSFQSSNTKKVVQERHTFQGAIAAIGYAQAPNPQTNALAVASGRGVAFEPGVRSRYEYKGGKEVPGIYDFRISNLHSQNNKLYCTFDITNPTLPADTGQLRIYQNEQRTIIRRIKTNIQTIIDNYNNNNIGFVLPDALAADGIGGAAWFNAVLPNLNDFYRNITVNAARQNHQYINDIRRTFFLKRYGDQNQVLCCKKPIFFRQEINGGLTENFMYENMIFVSNDQMAIAFAILNDINCILDMDSDFYAFPSHTARPTYTPIPPPNFPPVAAVPAVAAQVAMVQGGGSGKKKTKSKSLHMLKKKSKKFFQRGGVRSFNDMYADLIGAMQSPQFVFDMFKSAQNLGQENVVGGGAGGNQSVRRRNFFRNAPEETQISIENDYNSYEIKSVSGGRIINAPVGYQIWMRNRTQPRPAGGQIGDAVIAAFAAVGLQVYNPVPNQNVYNQPLPQNGIQDPGTWHPGFGIQVQLNGDIMFAATNNGINWIGRGGFFMYPQATLLQDVRTYQQNLREVSTVESLYELTIEADNLLHVPAGGALGNVGQLDQNILYVASSLFNQINLNYALPVAALVGGQLGLNHEIYNYGVALYNAFPALAAAGQPAAAAIGDAPNYKFLINLHVCLCAYNYAITILLPAAGFRKADRIIMFDKFVDIRDSLYLAIAKLINILPLPQGGWPNPGSNRLAILINQLPGAAFFFPVVQPSPFGPAFIALANSITGLTNVLNEFQNDPAIGAIVGGVPPVWPGGAPENMFRPPLGGGNDFTTNIQNIGAAAAAAAGAGQAQLQADINAAGQVFLAAINATGRAFQVAALPAAAAAAVAAVQAAVAAADAAGLILPLTQDENEEYNDIIYKYSILTAGVRFTGGGENNHTKNETKKQSPEKQPPKPEGFINHRQMLYLTLSCVELLLNLDPEESYNWFRRFTFPGGQTFYMTTFPELYFFIQEVEKNLSFNYLLHFIEEEVELHTNGSRKDEDPNLERYYTYSIQSLIESIFEMIDDNFDVKDSYKTYVQHSKKLAEEHESTYKVEEFREALKKTIEKVEDFNEKYHSLTVDEKYKLSMDGYLGPFSFYSRYIEFYKTRKEADQKLVIEILHPKKNSEETSEEEEKSITEKTKLKTPKKNNNRNVLKGGYKKYKKSNKNKK